MRQDKAPRQRLQDRAALAAEDRRVQSRWRDSYAGLLGRLGLYGQRANWTVCGLSVCVDAFAQLADCVELFAAGPPQARSLGAELYRRAAAGIGGEIRVDWAEGPQWVDAN